MWWRVCSNDHAPLTVMPYIFFFKIKNCLKDDLFISCNDRFWKMLHNICISAVAMSLRGVTRGPWASCFQNAGHWILKNVSVKRKCLDETLHMCRMMWIITFCAYLNAFYVWQGPFIPAFLHLKKNKKKINTKKEIHFFSCFFCRGHLKAWLMFDSCDFVLKSTYLILRGCCDCLIYFVWKQPYCFQFTDLDKVILCRNKSLFLF